MSTQHVQVAGVDERTVDAELFLIVEALGRIHHLNATGAAVWKLFAEPRSDLEIMAALAVAFPDVSEKEIRKAVTEMVEDLRRNALIVPLPSGDGNSDS